MIFNALRHLDTGYQTRTTIIAWIWIFTLRICKNTKKLNGNQLINSCFEYLVNERHLQNAVFDIYFRILESKLYQIEYHSKYVPSE